MSPSKYDDLGLGFEAPQRINVIRALESGDRDGQALSDWLLHATGSRCEWVTLVAIDGIAPGTRCREEAVKGPLPKIGGARFPGARVCKKHRLLLQGVVSRTNGYARPWGLAAIDDRQCSGSDCKGGQVEFEVRHSDPQGGPGKRYDSRTTYWCKECYSSILCGGLTL